MQTNVRFEFDDAFGRKDMRDDLALPSVLCSVASVENTATDGHEGIVKVGLESAVAVSVDDLDSVWVRNREVVRSNAYKCACQKFRKHRLGLNAKDEPCFWCRAWMTSERCPWAATYANHPSENFAKNGPG